jgi:cbb3-type cytochrome oxidase cytochrome c subunit
VNRETAAAVTAIHTGILIVFAIVLFALLNDPGDPAPSPLVALAEREDRPVDPLLERGWEVYQAEGCSSCHSIAGEGSPRYPLDGVADRLTSEELRLWVVDPQQMRPRVRKRAYDHLSEEEVEALVAFLQILVEP